MYFYCYVKIWLYICNTKIKEIITIKTLKIMTTAKQIWVSIKNLTYDFNAPSTMELLQEKEVNEVLNYLPAECLARTIIEQNIEKNMKSAHILINLSDKQRWVVAFELLKNEEYCKRFN